MSDHDAHHHQHHRGHHDHNTSHHVHFDTSEAAAVAELEGEVLLPLVRGLVDRVEASATEARVDVRHIADLGPGPGVGTCVLAERFPTAGLVAVDGSATMLAAATNRAARLGIGERLTTIRLDLDDDLGEVGTVDLAWASMALHHVGDEGAAFARIASILRPGGLFALVEGARPLTVVLPAADDPGSADPALADRLDAASRQWFAQMRATLPGATVSDDYRTMLRRAGLDIVRDEVVTTVLGPSLDDTALDYAREHLDRDAHRLRDHATPDDLAVLTARRERIEQHPAIAAATTIDASRRLIVVRRPTAP